VNDSMEQTLKKVINDIDLQGDDEMVFIENREQGIEDYGEEGMRCLEDLIWTNKDFQNVIEFGDDAYINIFPDFAEKAEGLIAAERDGKLAGLASSERVALAKELWAELGDVCIDDNERIDAEWREYPAGTPREEIWLDFEEEFGKDGVTVARLMGIEPWEEGSDSQMGLSDMAADLKDAAEYNHNEPGKGYGDLDHGAH
jgi:hypothetical protein